MAYDNEPERKCEHVVEAFQNPEVVNKYKAVVAWNLRKYQITRNPAKRRKVSTCLHYKGWLTRRKQIAAPICGTCQTSLARPFACLFCDFTGCWTGGHIVNHLKEAESEHTFCECTSL